MLEEDINLSPLIDVIFILLIFFIVTTVFIEESGVEINRPQAASAKTLDKTSILIAITQTGQVIYAGRDIGLNGVRSTVQRLLREQERPVVIQTDKRTTTDLLVKAIDEARLAGAASVNIATTWQPE